PSNTRCSKTAIIPKRSSSWRAKSNSTWAVRRPPREMRPSDASPDRGDRLPQGRSKRSASSRSRPRIPMTSVSTPATWLAGYIPDIPTPFDDNGGIDLAAFAGLCERQIGAGVSAILVSETGGEASTLSPAEQESIIRTAVEVAQGRVRVIAGAGSNSTSQAIELTQRAEAVGADAVLSVVPYYNKPMQDGIHAHFRAIAISSALPIILHDVPSRTMRELSDDTLLRLANSKHFIGLRDATGDIARLLRLRRLLPAGFRLLSGDDTTALSFIANGGDGC